MEGESPTVSFVIFTTFVYVKDGKIIPFPQPFIFCKDTHREKAPSNKTPKSLQEVQIWAFGLLLQQVNPL